LTAGRRALLDTIAGAPLAAHAAALLVVLLVLLPIVGTTASYSADEGAVIIQARSLSDGHGWSIPHPLPEVDPEGDAYPLELSPSGPKGVASYAKHPAYPLLLAGADRVGGHGAMVLLSLLGTWAAALGAAALARSLVDGYGRSALWLVGAGSPLLFDGYWVIAHSLAAAMVVWALHVTLRAHRARVPWASLVVVPLLLGLATLLRTEVALYAAGLGLAVVVLGLLERRVLMVADGVAMGASAFVARAIDAWWVERILGSPVGSTGSFVSRDRGGGVEERWDGFVATWLRPGPPGDRSLAVVAVVLGTLLVVAAGIALRRARPDLAVVAAGSAAVVLVARALLLPAEPIPSILVAFPILAFALVGLASMRWPFGRRVLLVAGGLAVSWAGVLATQYSEGGVAEWGGRFFAVGLPVVAPVVLVAAARLVDRASTDQARSLRWALAISLGALSVASVRELSDTHQQTERALDRIAALADEAGPDAVVVTDSPAIPRLDWAEFDEHRWLLLDPAADPDLPDRLAGERVDRWVLVSTDVEGALEAFDDVEVIEEASPNIVLVERRP
jgi:hypothetical protein